MGLRLTYIALLILCVKFIIQLWLSIKLNDHCNVTVSESVACHNVCTLYSPKLLELKGSNNLGLCNSAAVTNERLAKAIVLLFVAKTYNSAVLAVAQSFILTTHVRTSGRVY